MKPTEEPADAHCDFAGDESTSVMGVDLLSSLTERSRRIDVAASPVPDPEVSIVVDEVEPVTTVSPAVKPKLLVVDGQYPELSDEEPTVMMDEPEPTTVAVRHRGSPASPAEPPPTRPLQPPSPPIVAKPLPVPSAPDPQWAAELPPRALATIRVAPLALPALETPRAPEPAVGSRRLSALAAVALGVAAWTLGLGHHEGLPAAVMSPPPAASVSSAVVAPWEWPALAATIVEAPTSSTPSPSSAHPADTHALGVPVVDVRPLR